MKNNTPSSRSSRRSAGLHSVVTLVLFTAILLMVNYLGFKYYTHQDLSSSQYYTLSPKTIGILKNLDSPISVYTFLDQKNPQQEDEINNLIKEYQRIGGKNIAVEKIDPSYDIARATALQKQLRFSGNDYLIVFTYKDRPPHFVKQDDLYEANPMTQQTGSFKGEQQITSAIVSLVEGKPSKVYFTAGHGEHSIAGNDPSNGYDTVAQSVKGDNIEIAPLNLAQKGDVPEDADAVIIAGPSIAFSPIEVQALEKYTDNNGKLFILLDPYVKLGLDDLLKKYGMRFDDDLVLYRVTTTTGSSMTVPLAAIYQGGFSPHVITGKLAASNLQLLIQNVRSLTLLPDEKGAPNPKAQFLMQTDTEAWGWFNKAGSAAVDQKQLTFTQGVDLPGPVTIAAAYDGGKINDPTAKTNGTATRIVAIGNSKFVENDQTESVGSNFFLNSVDWLVKKDAILDIRPKTPQEYGLTLSPLQFNTVWWCALIFVPGAALALGILTWFSRRK